MAFSVRGKRVTVVGAATSGIAAAGLLARRGADVTLSDVRAQVPDAEPLRAQNVTLELGGHKPKTFTSADLIVMSPGVSPEQPAVQAARARGVPIVGEIELASWWLEGRVIAVTGTKGKSTTTALTGRMQSAGFRVTVGGNMATARRAGRRVDAGSDAHQVERRLATGQITFQAWIAVMRISRPTIWIGTA
jgi:UDP-N-acetylmuramoylalanine--D-glutamate ligase